jgi:hypothetical protein
MINTLDEDRVTVSRFSINEPDQKRVVSTKIDDVIRAIVELGGTYPDVVQALQAAKAAGALSSRFEVDALPKGGRTYYRKSAEEQPGEEETANEEGEIVVANPLPDLFSRRGYDEKDKAPKKKASDSDSSGDQKDDNADEKRQPIRSFLGKMVSRED